ncbi:uncharacterized protein BJ171DRAFT_511159 [Polychytrium aggregatum]|uniref:uncharacterized protein n=1 Tax=Polychytrium aggregatum TaxID=110093 RepID=UPI0022FE2BD2|nr:uncharacterized protein BJ171DRAFT_511159 [Polychytrium aggregatum]KAI9203218.1 hypothetical protein BJ171DRAFT_511159 [Polychytrium aggregatum]
MSPNLNISDMPSGSGSGMSPQPKSSGVLPGLSAQFPVPKIGVEDTVPIPAIPQRSEETFVTQRAGKIINIPVIPSDAQPSSLFENRRALQSTLLLNKKREMQQVQAMLEKKREEFAKRMEECREKQEELRTKQKQIRERVLKFEKFLKENDAKRQRANLKAQTEKKLKEQKEQELSALQRQLQEEQIKAKKILSMLKKYKVYEQYLQSVVDILPQDYLDVNEPHINDILMRYKTLIETNQDLIQMVQVYQDQMEKEQSTLAELIKDKQDLILVFNSQLGTQQKKYDSLKQHCAYLAEKLEERDKTGKERMRTLGEAKLAIFNIFDRISVRIQKPTRTNFLNAPNSENNNAASGADAQMASSPMTTMPLSSVHTKADISKVFSEKLHAIQERIIDLQHIIQKAEQAVAHERGERARKLAAVVGDS